LMGIVIYIGAISEEAGNKSKSAIEELPRFIYHYGSSFVLTVVSFISSEMNGVFSVYIYISQYQQAYHKEQEQLTLTDSREQHRITSHVNAVPRGSLGNFVGQACMGYTYTAMSPNCGDTVQRADVTSHVTEVIPQNNVVVNSHSQRTSLRSPRLNTHTNRLSNPLDYSNSRCDLSTSREVLDHRDILTCRGEGRERLMSSRNYLKSRHDLASSPDMYMPAGRNVLTADTNSFVPQPRDLPLLGRENFQGREFGVTGSRDIMPSREIVTLQGLRQYNRTTPV